MGNVKLWPLAPHTKAKHELLRRYLDRWFAILGKRFPRINYIDGFAGPGEYEGGEPGSPIIAIESARKHVERGTLSSRVLVNFVFTERRPDHSHHLEEKLELLKPSLPPQFKVRVMKDNFRDCVSELLDGIECNGKQLAPTFAFIDPFGFSGIPMELTARILRNRSCEVFINIMAESINRFLEHPNDGITAHFPETFGTDSVFLARKMPGDGIENLLSLYREQLSKHAKFVGRFDMMAKRELTKYSLFFGSNMPLGFIKMKEAMWAVDQKQGRSFFLPEQDQRFLFETMGIDPLRDQLRNRFGGKSASMASITTYVLERTDYLRKHALKILERMEADREIAISTANGYRRRSGELPDDKVSVSFST